MNIIITPESTESDIKKRLKYLNTQTPEYKQYMREYQQERRDNKKIEISKLHITEQFEIYSKEKESKYKSYIKCRDIRRKTRLEEKLKTIGIIETCLKRNDY